MLPVAPVTRTRVTKSALPGARRLVAKDDAEEGAVDLERRLAVVVDEAELLELVEEEIHPRPRGADHLGQRFLRYAGHDPERPVLLAVPGDEEERAREALLA